uniref:Protein maelstrom homolog n=1 Tax=Pavo cristatus TaxID=9049 RepID=A0A8C9FV74_PAVCR
MSRSHRSRSAYYFFVRDRLPVLQERGLPVARVVDAFPHLSQEWAVRGRAVLQGSGLGVNDVSPQRGVGGEALLAGGADSGGKICGLKVPVGPRKVLREHMLVKMYRVTSLLDASAISWMSDQAVLADIFYFLNVYSHGKLPSHCDQRFLPCEIGCVRYSLQEGIMADFHRFIDSGDFQGRSDDRFRISWCLERMASISPLELLTVEDLVIKLYQKKYHKEPSKTWVSRELDVVLWDFSSNTRCEWHEENDILCCALASCKKIAYCISKSLAGVYGVSLTAAHLPPKDCVSSGNTNLRRVILDAGRFQVSFFKFSYACVTLEKTSLTLSAYFFLQELKARGSGSGRHILSPGGVRELGPSTCEFEISPSVEKEDQHTCEQTQVCSSVF